MPHKRPFRASLAEWKSNFSCSNSCADAEGAPCPRGGSGGCRLPFPARSRSPDLHTNATVVAQNGQTRVYKVSAHACSFKYSTPQAAYPSSIWLFLQIRLDDEPGAAWPRRGHPSSSLRGENEWKKWSNLSAERAGVRLGSLGSPKGGGLAQWNRKFEVGRTRD